MRHALALLIGAGAFGVCYGIFLLAGPRLIDLTLLGAVGLSVTYCGGRAIMALWELICAYRP